ncbi:STAS domain-containing protein [Tepidibacter formicigenes]|jgi:anti-sigma B factor antagonist|uniref:Anti-sigma factor antagonist n=1 Tax=Tepidibacter formicigenes DSM 15518 TaxID=1123349 RepID=A0A1M6P7D1_9FIRM|nr:STAS domain-containing protein [Tepidibacter formicigenes]SHK03806.1 anti-sigma B factor antagonist [Tepidibacter formicigenes DSM 15518]
MSLVINKDFNKDKKIWNIELKGEIDIYTANKLKENLIEVVTTNPQDIILNASNLEYIDSTGLGVLIGTLKRLKQQEKDIYITNAKANVKKLFNITGLDKIFKVEG